MQDPILDIIGLGAGDGSDVARSHDRYLYQTRPGIGHEAALALLDSLPIGLIFADENDVTLLYNREAQRIFRRAPDRVAEILGTSMVDCHPVQTRSTVQQLVDDFRAGRRAELDGVKDVNGRAIRFTYRPVCAVDGRYLGAVEIVREVEATP